ncbi:hypothetical protein HPP92_021331 [Vanilla planifolia]|uniref:cysteine dioxygenase n=1 Tax=Vanilla planifolia TaxID=51239 RepID=A0A835Q252_VANPL|nr:hypothetical protein HPP92_021331 [Vanilla planifolia]
MVVGGSGKPSSRTWRSNQVCRRCTSSARERLSPASPSLPYPSKSSARLWIGIFCFPTSSVIPLHDHPGMTVLSKVLYGSVHVKAFDWIEPPCKIESGQSSEISVRLAKCQADTVLTAPCSTRVLYPNRGGNLHCFTAVTSVAILDVLAPPYSEFAGRSCTYYHDYPYSCFSSVKELGMDEEKEDYVWLEKIDAPDNFYMRSGNYRGPSIQENSNSTSSCTIA